MKFTKMHGIGNDYIYFNCLEKEIENPEELSIKLSDRHFGVGGDGIVLILPSDKADFRMRMFNADGSEGKMCGNATRCIGKYVYDKGITDNKEITLETLSGIKTLKISVNEKNKVESVEVNMGEAILKASEIPVKSDKEKVINERIKIADSEYIRLIDENKNNKNKMVAYNRKQKKLWLVQNKLKKLINENQDK